MAKRSSGNNNGALTPRLPDRDNGRGGKLRTGNPGNRGGRSYPLTYRKWLKSLLKSEKHRREFEGVMQDADHPAFMSATKHAADHAHGPPKQRLEHTGRDGGPIQTEQLWKFGNREIKF